MAVPGETREGRDAYLSTFYWFPIVNGNSGNFPPTYLARIDRMREFPSASALYQLRYDRVTYLVVHESGYPPEDVDAIHAAMAGAAAVDLGVYDDGEGKARLYRLR
jgi:hypothetical protein